eukprot:1159323-Pelagomonas_calceolata.AAC.1
MGSESAAAPAGDAAGAATDGWDAGADPPSLCACMGDVACACTCTGAAAAGACCCRKPIKLCWPCLDFLPASLCLLHASTCVSLLNLLSNWSSTGTFKSSTLTLL